MLKEFTQIAVFGKTQKEANAFLNTLTNNMKFGDVESVRIYPRMETLLKDGTRYIALVANDSSRGHRFKKAYVQSGIDIYAFNAFIRMYFTNEQDVEYFE